MCVDSGYEFIPSGSITLVGIACIIMCEVYATMGGKHIPEPKLSE